MGSNTITFSDEADEQLAAEKRVAESFSETVKRLITEIDSVSESTSGDWRDEFGCHADRDLNVLRDTVTDQQG